MQGDLISKLNFSNEEKADISDIELIDFLFKNIDDETTAKWSSSLKFAFIISILCVVISSSTVKNLLFSKIENPYLKLVLQFCMYLVIFLVYTRYLN